jgi:hypothetical protein
LKDPISIFIVYATSEHRPPVNNGYTFRVSRVVIAHRFDCTVKPVYNGHPWDLKKVAVGQRCLIKLRF